MKKILAFLLVLALTLSLAACGSSPAPTTPSSTQSSQEAAPSSSTQEANPYELKSPVNLTFATQEVGTGAYQYASAFASVMLNELPAGSNIDLTTTSPGGVGAPIVLDNAQCDLIMSNAGPAKWAQQDGILGNPPTTNVTALAGGLGRDFVNVLFTQAFVDKTGITSVEELVEKKYPVKLVIKQNGTLGALTAEKVLLTFGLTFEDIKAWGGEVTQTGGDAIKSLLQDGKADMTIDHLAAGQANTTELCMTTKMYFPQLSDDTLKKMVAMGYDYIDIEPNTWNGQTEKIKSVGSQQVILVHRDMDDAVVYNLTKAICENKQDLVNAMAALGAFDPATAGTLVKTGVELHPGARAYYKEMGYKVD